MIILSCHSVSFCLPNRIHTAEVTGSIPVPPTIEFSELHLVNPLVSLPTPAAPGLDLLPSTHGFGCSRLPQLPSITERWIAEGGPPIRRG